MTNVAGSLGGSPYKRLRNDRTTTSDTPTPTTIPSPTIVSASRTTKRIIGAERHANGDFAPASTTDVRNDAVDPDDSEEQCRSGQGGHHHGRKARAPGRCVNGILHSDEVKYGDGRVDGGYLRTSGAHHDCGIAARTNQHRHIWKDEREWFRR
jgi:hypothetical protein